MIIRVEQLLVFEQSALRQFEDEMVDHGKRFAPVISGVIGDAQLRVAVKRAIAKAGQHGFILRGPIRLCVELMFLCGSGFDDDPQYPGIARLFKSEETEMRKAQRIHFAQLEYLELVAGPGNINVHKALRALSVYARSGPELTESSLDAELIAEMSRAFPERSEYIGESSLRALIAEGRAEASRYGFTSPRAQALIVILMSAFGHRCTDDPLYPWIARTLTDPKIVDAIARSARLERKAITWLDHVLARTDPVMPE